MKKFFDGDVTTCQYPPPPLSPLVTDLSVCLSPSSPRWRRFWTAPKSPDIIETESQSQCTSAINSTEIYTEIR